MLRTSQQPFQAPWQASSSCVAATPALLECLGATSPESTEDASGGAFEDSRDVATAPQLREEVSSIRCWQSVSTCRRSRRCRRTSTRCGTLSSTSRWGSGSLWCFFRCSPECVQEHLQILAGEGRGGSAQHPVYAARHAPGPQVRSEMPRYSNLCCFSKTSRETAVGVLGFRSYCGG